MAAADHDLTVADVAETLRCSMQYVRQLIAAGLLAARDDRLPGARRAVWRITPQALHAFRFGDPDEPDREAQHTGRHLAALPDVA